MKIHIVRVAREILARNSNITMTKAEKKTPWWRWSCDQRGFLTTFWTWPACAIPAIAVCLNEYPRYSQEALAGIFCVSGKTTVIQIVYKLFVTHRMTNMWNIHRGGLVLSERYLGQTTLTLRTFFSLCHVNGVVSNRAKIVCWSSFTRLTGSKTAL